MSGEVGGDEHALKDLVVWANEYREKGSLGEALAERGAHFQRHPRHEGDFGRLLSFHVGPKERDDRLLQACR
jgi:hypothetical protein